MQALHAVLSLGMVSQITAEAALARALSARNTPGPSSSSGPLPGGGAGSGAVATGTSVQIDAASNEAQTKIWQARLQRRKSGSGPTPTGFAAPAPVPPLGMQPIGGPAPVGTHMSRADSIDFISPAIPRSTSLGDMDSRLVDQLGIALQEKGKLEQMKRFVMSQQQAGYSKKDRVTKLLTKLVALLGVEAVVAATNAVVYSSDVETMLLRTLKDRLTPAQRKALQPYEKMAGTPMSHIKLMQQHVHHKVVVQSLCEVRNRSILHVRTCMMFVANADDMRHLWTA